MNKWIWTSRLSIKKSLAAEHADMVEEKHLLSIAALDGIALHPKPSTPNPELSSYPQPQTLHPTPYTLNPVPYTLHPTPYTLNPKPQTRNPKS